MASSCLIPLGAGLISIKRVDTSADIPVCVSLVFFYQQLGGAIFVSVGENVSGQKFIAGLTRVIDENYRQHRCHRPTPHRPS
ncbi:hypothetical protein N7537_000038 [Penicillium hordei]|uniref:Uncharacterized protein n=1 Tax=Penicillium hordei TaxID=40994 RepID=A0AAD6H7W7_9EURO|nr:uncharacterized protein N7537_000038 [Penicillium hordei]KAJ5614924.1 hypothetical protein N7537_000038 [Penicillium hordei]